MAERKQGMDYKIISPSGKLHDIEIVSLSIISPAINYLKPLVLAKTLTSCEGVEYNSVLCMFAKSVCVCSILPSKELGFVMVSETGHKMLCKFHSFANTLIGRIKEDVRALILNSRDHGMKDAIPRWVGKGRDQEEIENGLKQLRENPLVKPSSFSDGVNLSNTRKTIHFKMLDQFYTEDGVLKCETISVPCVGRKRFIKRNENNKYSVALPSFLGGPSVPDSGKKYKPMTKMEMRDALAEEKIRKLQKELTKEHYRVLDAKDIGEIRLPSFLSRIKSPVTK